MGINTLDNRNIFPVPVISIEEVTNCEIEILEYESGIKTRHGDGRYIVRICHDGIERKFFTNATPILEPIQEFKNRQDLPEELFNLDILDGSPPCSTFSISGDREESWGVEKKFREGQANQVLDRLFFDFIDLAKRLQSKVVVAENVKGILLGDAIRGLIEKGLAIDVNTLTENPYGK